LLGRSPAQIRFSFTEFTHGMVVIGQVSVARQETLESEWLAGLDPIFHLFVK
jgi:hypothetical protein